MSLNSTFSAIRILFYPSEYDIYIRMLEYYMVGTSLIIPDNVLCNVVDDARLEIVQVPRLIIKEVGLRISKET